MDLGNGLSFKETSQLIGYCGITVEEIDGKQETELGYRLSENYWGHGDTWSDDIPIFLSVALPVLPLVELSVVPLLLARLLHHILDNQKASTVLPGQVDQIHCAFSLHGHILDPAFCLFSA